MYLSLIYLNLCDFRMSSFIPYITPLAVMKRFILNSAMETSMFEP